MKEILAEFASFDVLLEVTVRGGDEPDVDFQRARAADTLASEYVQFNLEYRTDATRKSLDFLAGEIAKQQKKVEDSERAMAEYRETNNALSLEDRQNTVVASLNQVNDQYTRVRTERIQKEALYNQIKPLPLTLLALDLDKFKVVNDTMGHEAGDELLKQVAARLTPLIDDGSGLVARLGGDEFMVLLWGKVDAESVAALADTIVQSLREPFRLAYGVANIGVSVGIATAITDERKDLVSRADFALYDAKESGRNTFRVFDELKKAA